ncbi:hypothetical protein CABS03_06961 [Colletotrichum abscissum]|uniref:Uncharacterized protein n=1 Tax=Colletotrichum abscissum TaxID=1671311 RepID=A0A9P9XJI1_9PEZI|nr:hypothetical protein CABS02_05513 [Colletotrichum abscissum]
MAQLRRGVQSFTIQSAPAAAYHSCSKPPQAAVRCPFGRRTTRVEQRGKQGLSAAVEVERRTQTRHRSMPVSRQAAGRTSTAGYAEKDETDDKPGTTVLRRLTDVGL